MLKIIRICDTECVSTILRAKLEHCTPKKISPQPYSVECFHHAVKVTIGSMYSLTWDRKIHRITISPTRGEKKKKGKHFLHVKISGMNVFLNQQFSEQT